MEPAVRKTRAESAIVTDRTRNGAFWPPKTPNIPGLPNDIDRRRPRRGERNFWTQRRDAEIGLRDRKCHRRPKERNDTGENPHRNGLSRVGVGICGLEGLGGGVRSQIRTGLHLQFPANREINREFCDFDAFGSDFGTKDPCAAATSRRIPYEN